MTQETAKGSKVLITWLIILTLVQALQTGIIIHILTLVHNRI